MPKALKMAGPVIVPAAKEASAQQAGGPLYQGVEKLSAGYKLMAAMGWREGEGLVSRELAMTPKIALFYFLDTCTRPISHRCHPFSQGATKQGIKSHVRVKKKIDALGVGAVSDILRPPSASVHGDNVFRTTVAAARVGTRGPSTASRLVFT